MPNQLATATPSSSTDAMNSDWLQDVALLNTMLYQTTVGASFSFNGASSIRHIGDNIVIVNMDSNEDVYAICGESKNPYPTRFVHVRIGQTSHLSPSCAIVRARSRSQRRS